MPGKTAVTFSLNFCPITFGSLPVISGFASGDAFTLEFSNDDFERVEGSDGHVIWIQKHNSVADCTIRLAQGNYLIALFRQLHELSLAAGGITYPFSAVNLKSSDEAVTGTAMLMKRIGLKWGDGESPAEIKFDLQVTTIAGGTIVPT